MILPTAWSISLLIAQHKHDRLFYGIKSYHSMHGFVQYAVFEFDYFSCILISKKLFEEAAFITALGPTSGNFKVEFRPICAGIANEYVKTTVRPISQELLFPVILVQYKTWKRDKNTSCFILRLQLPMLSPTTISLCIQIWNSDFKMLI